MLRWIKQNVLYVSVGRLGVFFYVHFLPNYTYDFSIQWGRRVRQGSKLWHAQQAEWAAVAQSDYETDKRFPK